MLPLSRHSLDCPLDFSLRFATPYTLLTHLGDIATFVALTALRQGVGAALTRASLVAARGLGFEKLMATVRADNPGALAFYRHQGFARVGTARRHARIGEHYIDEVILERALN